MCFECENILNIHIINYAIILPLILKNSSPCIHLKKYKLTLFIFLFCVHIHLAMRKSLKTDRVVCTNGTFWYLPHPILFQSFDKKNTAKTFEVASYLCCECLLKVWIYAQGSHLFSNNSSSFSLLLPLD